MDGGSLSLTQVRERAGEREDGINPYGVNTSTLSAASTTSAGRYGHGW